MDRVNKLVKTCKGCGRTLPLSDFYNHGPSHNSKDGTPSKRSKCKKCHNKATAEFVGRRRKELRLMVLKKLCPNGIKCFVCGFSDDIRFLQIDHVKGGGYEERKERGADTQFHRAILKMTDEEAREKYQILCILHNWARRYGITGEEYIIIKSS